MATDFVAAKWLKLKVLQLLSETNFHFWIWTVSYVEVILGCDIAGRSVGTLSLCCKGPGLVC